MGLDTKTLAANNMAKLIEILEAHPEGVLATDLEAALGVGRRTIQRYMRIMRGEPYHLDFASVIGYRLVRGEQEGADNER